MLSLQDVTKSYIEPGGGRLPILDIASFRVAAGEQMVLIGRSGCGKSTLLYVIAGITTADAGKIVIDGVDVGGLSEVGRDRFRADKIGYVFQTFNLLPAYSALENVLLGMTFSRGRAGLCFLGLSAAKPPMDPPGVSHRPHYRSGDGLV